MKPTQQAQNFNFLLITNFIKFTEIIFNLFFHIHYTHRRLEAMHHSKSDEIGSDNW
jgi:hypothetical protein